MNQEQAIDYLLRHSDPNVRDAAAIVQNSLQRKNRVLKLVQEALSQIRLDVKYLVFDLDCTRKERDNLIERLR